MSSSSRDGQQGAGREPVLPPSLAHQGAEVIQTPPPNLALVHAQGLACYRRYLTGQDRQSTLPALAARSAPLHRQGHSLVPRPEAPTPAGAEEKEHAARQPSPRAEDDPALLATIAGIIEQLSPCERLVVTLFFYEDLTLPEI